MHCMECIHVYMLSNPEQASIASVREPNYMILGHLRELHHLDEQRMCFCWDTLINSPLCACMQHCCQHM